MPQTKIEGNHRRISLISFDESEWWIEKIITKIMQWTWDQKISCALPKHQTLTCYRLQTSNPNESNGEERRRRTKKFGKTVEIQTHCAGWNSPSRNEQTHTHKRTCTRTRTYIHTIHSHSFSLSPSLFRSLSLSMCFNRTIEHLR